VSPGRWIPPSIVGSCRFDSRTFSNRWTLHRDGQVIAELRRDPTRHTSSGMFADGTSFVLVPNGWGTVEILVEGSPIGRIDRRSWWGRRWEIGGSGFGCDLTSDPLPRRWTFRLGGEPIARLAGGLISYNRLDVVTHMTLPAHAVILAWHVLARPWEAAAAPRSLVPDRAPAQ
jgi:hypothetical protein